MGIDIKKLKEVIEQDFRNEETDEEFGEVENINAILKFICECVYIDETDKDGLMSEYLNIHVLINNIHYLLYEVLNSKMIISEMRIEEKDSISEEDFWNDFCVYKDEISKKEVYGEHIQKIKELFIFSHDLEGWNSSQKFEESKFLFLSRVKRFFLIILSQIKFHQIQNIYI